ncbi:MAG: threonine/serine ThrE exporter family protein [Bdellovibrionales bacterium]
MVSADLKEKLLFFVELSSFLQKYGTGSNDLEAELSKLALKLKIKGSFMTTPTAISMTLNDQDGSTLSQMTRVYPGGIDLFKLNEAKKIIDEIHAGQTNLKEAIEKLKSLEGESLQYGVVLKTLGFPLTSAGLTYLSGGSVQDLFAAFATGLMVALLVFNLKSKKIEAVKETVIALFATILVFSLKTQFPELNVQIIVMASLIVLIPGLSLTIAIGELASKHLVSGTARLMGAVVDFGKITAGIVAGYHMATNFNISQSQPALKLLEIRYELIAIVVCALSVAIIFNASRRDIKWVVANCLITMIMLKIGHMFFVNNMAMFMAALTAGLVSNIYARFYRTTPATLLLPAVIFLVPGSIGMKGLHLLLKHQYVLGVEEVVRATIVAVMIVAGIFFSEIIADPNPKKGRMVG